MSHSGYSSDAPDMAEAYPSLGGYDEEFVDDLEDYWLCPICQLPLKEAVQTGICGHRFCKQCLEGHFTRQERDSQLLRCPLDQNILIRDKDIFPDKATERKIRSFVIKCPRDGCHWTGELRAKEDHENDCTRFPVNCPNGCGEFIPREEIFWHTEDDCTLAPVPCPYAHMGCTEKVLQTEVESHLQSETRLHLDLACVKVRNTEEELRTTKEQFKKLEERINALENKPFVYTWKIDSFSEILRHAKTGDKVKIQSAPFYTSECGYKVRIRLYPNGNSYGKNTHLSIFIHIVKGDYDSILQWPFSKQVTFTLLDQQENLVDRKNITKSFSKSFKKEENTHSWGFPEFVSQDELMERGYVLDDTIFIQAKIANVL